jgi:hypothetical protein
VISVVDIFDSLEELQGINGRAISEFRMFLQLGPAKWVRFRFIEFVIGFVVGITTGVADAIFLAFASVRNAVAAAGTAVLEGFGPVGEAVLVAIASLENIYVSVATAAGPASPLVAAVLVVLTVALLIRLVRAVADALPVVSGIQTFLEGS